MGLAAWARVLCLGAVLLLSGCDGMHAGTPAPTGKVLVDSFGTCPMRQPPGAKLPQVCMLTKGGNAVTPIFAMPHKAWGIAYAFNCGAKPNFFYVYVGLPSYDGQLPDTEIARTGRKGSGYFMETGKGWATISIIPTQWQNPQNLEIRSPCAWHVVAVKGSKTAVKSRVPAVPKAG